jgi:hypothetical protein
VQDVTNSAASFPVMDATCDSRKDVVGHSSKTLSPTGEAAILASIDTHGLVIVSLAKSATISELVVGILYIEFAKNKLDIVVPVQNWIFAFSEFSSAQLPQQWTF